MTDKATQDQLQTAHDLIEVMQEQRDAANNNIVQLGGQIKALRRKIAELEAMEAKRVEDEIEAKKVAADQSALNEPDLFEPKSVPNGRDHHAVS